MNITIKTGLVERGSALRVRTLWRGVSGWLGLGETVRREWSERITGVLAASLLVTAFLMWIGVGTENLLSVLPLVGLPLIIALLFDG